MLKYACDNTFLSFLKQFDICAFNETWSKSLDEFNDFLEGYICFNNNRKKRYSKGRYSGGVCVFIRADLVEKGFIKRVFNHLDNCVFLRLDGELLHLNNSVIFCFLYISPEGSTSYNNINTNNGIELLEDSILEVITKYTNDELVLAGDFNARCGLLQDYMENDDVDYIFNDENSLYDIDYFKANRNSKDTICNQFGMTLIELCKTLGIHMLNGRIFNDKTDNFTSTANDGSSLVDYFIVSSNLFSYITHFEIGNRHESDHFPLICNMSFNTLTLENNNESNGNHSNNAYDFKRYKWDDDKKESFVNNLRTILSNVKSSIIDDIDVDVNSAINKIVNMFQNAARRMKIKPFVKQNNTLQPDWWDYNCDNLKKDKLQKLKLFRLFNTQTSLHDYIQSRNNFKSCCKLKQTDLQEKHRLEIVESRENTNLFWKTVKKFKFKNTKQRDNTVSKCEWFEHFSQLLYCDDIENGNVNLLPELENIDAIFNTPFSLEELQKSIISLKVGKSTGPSGILPEMIKCTLTDITDLLLPLYNTILVTSDFPEYWGQSILCPFHKAGSFSDPNNFRGISLIDTLNKVLTGMIFNRITKWAESNNKIDQAQSGFRNGLSTIDNLFTLQAMVQKYLSKKGGRFYCLFVDFSKAFDTTAAFHN